MSALLLLSGVFWSACHFLTSDMQEMLLIFFKLETRHVHKIMWNLIEEKERWFTVKAEAFSLKMEQVLYLSLYLTWILNIVSNACRGPCLMSWCFFSFRHLKMVDFGHYLWTLFNFVLACYDEFAEGAGSIDLLSNLPCGWPKSSNDRSQLRTWPSFYGG